MTEKAFHNAVGRRKEATARAKMQIGTGIFQINGKEALEYLGNAALVAKALTPLKLLSLEGKRDIQVKIVGGGRTGQTEAIRHALARILVKEDETAKSVLRKAGFITRDPRVKERKKYGLKRARKAPQFSKR